MGKQTAGVVREAGRAIILTLPGEQQKEDNKETPNDKSYNKITT